MKKNNLWTKLTSISNKIAMMIVVLWSAVSLSSNIYADTALSKIDIVPREERWANENLRIYVPKTTNVYTPQKPPTTLEIKENIAENYLLSNFKDEFKIDKIIREDFVGRILKRPLQYKYNKKKIVIHHTAWEVDHMMSIYDEKEEIRKIYQFHSNTRDRWDIWYNYIIWPSGKIYEWRYGWSEVVWAHVRWNNTDTVWISLLGNFDIQEPTQAQLDSLINLSTAISEDYHMDPYSKLTYHKFDSSWPKPYIRDIKLDSIVWHGDVWDTSCPWANIKKRMDYIKGQVAMRMQEHKIDHYKDLTEIIYKNKLIIPWPDFVAKIKISDISKNIWWLNGSCKSSKFDVNCNIVWDYLHISINKKNNINGEIDIILGTNNKKDYVVFIPIVYISNVNDTITKLEKLYPASDNKNKYEKISVKITPEQAQKKSKEDISVLLHELTLLYDTLDISCTNECIITIKNWSKISQIKSNKLSTTRIGWSNQIAYILWNQEKNTANEVSIEDSSWWDVVVDNYSRKSYAGIPWNKFAGKLIIKPDYIKIRWSDQYRIVYINQLPFLDYMRWLAETNDQEEQEKVNTLYLVSKNYAMFYMFNNKQDGMSDNRTYNLTDSPEINQKYVGAWFKTISNKWNLATSTLQDKYIYHDNAIAILPYFNCSAWFTYDADRFGWTDAPYLQSVIDIYGICEGGKWFNWHWVGMSWKWANWLAKAWYTYKDIINYYYDDVDIR